MNIADKYLRLIGMTAFFSISSVGVFGATEACTKQQAVNVANTGVQVAIDLCALAPQLLPPNTPAGTVVALLCPMVDNAAQTVEVLIDQVIYSQMLAEYRKTHPSFSPKVADDQMVSNYRKSRGY
jgi:hypothetical protein